VNRWLTVHVFGRNNLNGRNYSGPPSGCHTGTAHISGITVSSLAERSSADHHVSMRILSAVKPLSALQHRGTRLLISKAILFRSFVPATMRLLKLCETNPPDHVVKPTDRCLGRQ